MDKDTLKILEDAERMIKSIESRLSEMNDMDKIEAGLAIIKTMKSINDNIEPSRRLLKILWSFDDLIAKLEA
jgi:DNA mismatch repair ATPase MutS